WVDHEPWVTRSSRWGSGSAGRKETRPGVRAPWASIRAARRPLVRERPDGPRPTRPTPAGPGPSQRPRGRLATRAGTGNIRGPRGRHAHEDSERSIVLLRRPRTRRPGAPVP